MGLDSPDFDTALADAHQIIDGVGGELIESYHHKIPGLAMPHERIFAQYANRCQVDMVVIPASEKYPGVKDEVRLYDPEGIRAAKWEPTPVTAKQVREWAFNGWACLADVGKYLRRGSAWEALERLHQARAEYWRLLATSADVPNPQYGITSLLDFAPAERSGQPGRDGQRRLPHPSAARGQEPGRRASRGRHPARARVPQGAPRRDGRLHHRRPGARRGRKLEPVLPLRRPTWQDQTVRFSYAESMTDPSYYLPLARAAEEAGYDSMVVPDSICYPEHATSTYPYSPDGTREFLDGKPFIEPFSLIPALGVVTKRLRFTTFVLKLPIRNPVLVAKQATSTAVLTGNRLLLGVGTSPWREDYEILGVPWERRGLRLDEEVEIIRGLAGGGYYGYDGKIFKIPPIKLSPVPTVTYPDPVRGPQRGHAAPGGA